jgi:hypothetical protein
MSPHMPFLQLVSSRRERPALATRTLVSAEGVCGGLVMRQSSRMRRIPREQGDPRRSERVTCPCP